MGTRIWKHKKVTNTSSPEMIVLNYSLHLEDANYSTLSSTPKDASDIYRFQTLYMAKTHVLLEN